MLLAAWKTLLGRLINDSARLRFFPHRAVMFLTLAELTRDGAQRQSLLVAADTTIEDFSRIASGMSVQHAVYGVDSELGPWLTGMLNAHCSDFTPMTERFFKDALVIAGRMKAGKLASEGLIKLGYFVSKTLFGCINPLVDAFALELARVSEVDKAQSIRMEEGRLSALNSGVSIHDLAEELNRINSTIQMISINSRIQAAHLGPQGKPFALLAGEIQHLSNQIVGLTDRIKTQVGSFAATDDLPEQRLQSFG